jgi:hypothetical protein
MTTETIHRVLFYPVGNGDTSQIVLANKKRLLFDFCHRQQGEDPQEPLIDLKKRLTEELKEAQRDYYDVVALTHGDDDHIAGSTDFFELQHAVKYQGKDRVKIRELWVPAAMVLEPATQDEKSDEVIIWRQEARHRLKEGKGIRVFSKPDKLKQWLEENGLSVESRKHLITDAGQLVPGFTLESDGLEFFVHSPFVKHVDGVDIARNEASLIFQVRFVVEGTRTDYFAVGDSDYDVLEDIVSTTVYHKRAERLDWHLYNVPHHCSYKALAQEKGDRETVPTEKVKELLLHGQPNAYVVSSSRPISDDSEGYKQEQPPHIQARKAYQRYLEKVGGRKLLVTMEEPNGYRPEPIEFEITGKGLRRAGKDRTGGLGVVAATTPRAGFTTPRAG